MREPYTLYHGDCLDILPTLEAQSVDAVICDPPYGTTACKWDSVIPFEPMWAGIKRVLKPRGACVLFGSQPFTSALVMSNPKWFKYTWVWERGTPGNYLNANYQPLISHEDIATFSLGNTCPAGKLNAMMYNPQGVQAYNKETRRSSGGKTYARTGSIGLVNIQQYTNHPRTVLRFADDSPRIHPTQKPLALLEYLVRTYTNEGDTVLDFTFGSGTTGAACGNLGRRFVGIEKDAEYFRLGSERIATAYAPLRMMEVA